MKLECANNTREREREKKKCDKIELPLECVDYLVNATNCDSKTPQKIRELCQFAICMNVKCKYVMSMKVMKITLMNLEYLVKSQSWTVH